MTGLGHDRQVGRRRPAVRGGRGRGVRIGVGEAVGGRAVAHDRLTGLGVDVRDLDLGGQRLDEPVFGRAGLVRVIEGPARLGQGPEIHQLHAVAGGADLAIDLVASLQLVPVEAAERPLEAEAAVSKGVGSALGGHRGLGREGQAGGGGDQDQGLLHGADIRLEGHGRAQPFISTSPPGRTGSEIVAGIGCGVSRRPTRGMMMRKKAK